MASGAGSSRPRYVEEVQVSTYKHIAESYRTRRGVRYNAIEYGLEWRQAVDLVAAHLERGVKAFKERDRYIGGGELYIVFAAKEITDE